MTTEIDLAEEKYPFLTNTSFLNKGKVTFLQKKNQDTTRQKCCQNIKRDSLSAYVYMRSDTHSPCTQLYAFWMTPHPPPVAYVLD